MALKNLAIPFIPFWWSKGPDLCWSQLEVYAGLGLKLLLGEELGEELGELLGDEDGLELGDELRELLGDEDGEELGELLGLDDGELDGLELGLLLGLADTEGYKLPAAAKVNTPVPPVTV